MRPPDAADAQGVARTGAAPQRRARGPHPLADFLALAAEAVGHDRRRLAEVLAGVRAYQAHSYARALPEPPTVARVGSARLLDYGGEGPPALFVPSLINPPTVLDLAADNSLLRWLAASGVRPLLIDWGTPGAAEPALDIDGYVGERLLPLLEAVPAPAAVVGYCLGGTMALLAAARGAAVRRLALIATPWRFDGYDAARRAALAAYWRSVEPAAIALGAVPMEMVQPVFWRLNPAGAAAKFAGFARRPSDAFVALEDWANDGPPLSLAAARQLFAGFYGNAACRNEPNLAVPVANFVSATDRIVPSAAAPEIGVRSVIAAGHVGMVVGSRARGALWQPLRDFLAA